MGEKWVDSIELRYAMFSVISNNWKDIIKKLKHFPSNNLATLKRREE
jgi:hypothetical protein